MKKFLKVILGVLFCLVVAVGIAVGAFFLFYTPSLTADMSVKTGAVTNGASGYLYGIAEEGVPSKNMTESIDISTAVAKVPDGLQHPIGDASNVYTHLENTDYTVVYLQDAYSTWYYEHEAIFDSRRDDKYDWKEFLANDYLPRVEQSVATLSSAPYSDKVVYCLYNECDNGIWFGETKVGEDGNIYAEFNSVGEQNFFEAWKITYDYVRSINPNALIGGPGYCDYDSGEIERFMTYCAENACVPDVMIYHELSDFSVLFWQQHVDDYRQLEQKLGIDKCPVIVTEYGRMCDNGLPGKMVQYITQIENSKVYADNAYWRLANNLCDVSADDNSPNSNWWLFRWYTDMQGQTVESKYVDLFRSNFENAYIKKKANYTSWGFMGIVSISDSSDRIEAICGGREGSAVVKLKNMNSTGLYGKRVCVTIEETLYRGLSGIVSAPVVKQVYYTDVKSKTLTVDLNDMDASSAYHITVVPVCDIDKASDTSMSFDDYKNDRYIKRYEFEQGTLLGGAYTYNNWYAATGGNANYIPNVDDLVGGMENDGDGVEIKINVPADGTYDLNIIYGNSNDGVPDENGKVSPDDRKNSTTILSVDDNECELSFSNTIKSEFTDCMTICWELEKGEHTVCIKRSADSIGTIVLDSLLVMANEEEDIAVLADNDRSGENAISYLVVAPIDGYYDISAKAGNYRINNIGITLSEGHNDVYLMRGLNYVDKDNADGIVVSQTKTAGKSVNINATDVALSGGAKIGHNDLINVDYITGISCKKGKAELNVNAEKSGYYAVTFLYANNEEGGFHDYNIDLIERYVTVTANGRSQDVYCRNTYSWDNYKTVTCYVELKKGNNTITLTNSGNTKFNNRDTYAPYINAITVSEICA